MSYGVFWLEELLGGVSEHTDTGTPGQRISTVPWWITATSFNLGSNPTPIDFADENRGLSSAPPSVADSFRPDGTIEGHLRPNLFAALLTLSGWVPTIDQGNGTNEIQTLTCTGTPTGGEWDLTVLGQKTIPIPYNVTAAQLQEALEGTRAIRPGDVLVTGGPFPGTPLVVTFQGRHAARSIAAITVDDDDLTGGTSPEITVAETAAGATGSILDPDGNGLTAGSYRVQFTKRVTAEAKTATFLAVWPEHNVAIRGTGYGISELSVNARESTFQATLAGLTARPEGLPNPALTPAPDSVGILPLRRGDLELTWLGGEKRTTEFDFTVTNPIEAQDYLGAASYYPQAMEYTDTYPSVAGNVSRNAIDKLSLQALEDLRQFSAKARWLGESSVSTSGTAYGLWLEMPGCQIPSGGQEAQTTARRTPSSFAFEARYSESAGFDARFTVVCAVAQLESYS